MLLSALIPIPLEASRSTWKSAGPVQTRMEATLREEVGFVVVVEATRAVQEAAREGVAFRRMEAAVAILLVADEVETCPREAAANPRLHNPMVKLPKR